MRNYFKTMFKERYPYPIAYTDGTISRLKSHKEGRTAVGFIVKGYIITLHPVEVDAQDAYNYNKVVKNTGCFLEFSFLFVSWALLFEKRQYIMLYHGKNR